LGRGVREEEEQEGSGGMGEEEGTGWVREQVGRIVDKGMGEKIVLR